MFSIWSKKIQSPLTPWEERVWQHDGENITYAYRFYFKYHLHGFLSLKLTKISYDKPCMSKLSKLSSILTVDSDIFDDSVFEIPIPFFKLLDDV